jgi:hypothetical protein
MDCHIIGVSVVCLQQANSRKLLYQSKWQPTVTVQAIKMQPLARNTIYIHEQANCLFELHCGTPRVQQHTERQILLSVSLFIYDLFNDALSCSEYAGVQR